MSTQVVDHYEVLGIGPDADAKTIRAAYFALAKTYHPDRQVEHTAENTERFLAVQAAYEVLSRPRQRGEYDLERERARARTEAPAPKTPEKPAPEKKKAPPESQKSRGPTLEEEKDARMAFMKAENLMAEGKHEQALRIMRAVVRTVRDNPDYLSLAGYLQALVGDDSMHRARDLCQMAVEAQPFNAEYLARLGFVYQVVGLESRAQDHFQRALAKDPKQAIARAHLKDSGGSSGGPMDWIRRLLGR